MRVWGNIGLMARRDAIYKVFGGSLVCLQMMLDVIIRLHGTLKRDAPLPAVVVCVRRIHVEAARMGQSCSGVGRCQRSRIEVSVTGLSMCVIAVFDCIIDSSAGCLSMSSILCACWSRS